MSNLSMALETGLAVAVPSFNYTTALVAYRFGHSPRSSWQIKVGHLLLYGTRCWQVVLGRGRTPLP